MGYDWGMGETGEEIVRRLRIAPYDYGLRVLGETFLEFGDLNGEVAIALEECLGNWRAWPPKVGSTVWYSYKNGWFIQADILKEPKTDLEQIEVRTTALLIDPTLLSGRDQRLTLIYERDRYRSGIFTPVKADLFISSPTYLGKQPGNLISVDEYLDMTTPSL